MIKDYFSIKENDSHKYNFSFIRITEDKPKDDALILELQKSILRAYRTPNFLQRKKRNLDRDGLKKYIQKNVIPNKITNFDVAVRYGDFGEIFASLIIKYIQNKEPFTKLRWKYNSNKSVFGTDIVAFDSLDNPREISYYEVKTRENALKKEKEKEENKFITVIAYKSLEQEKFSDKESILDFMSRLYENEGNYGKSDIFSDLVDDARVVNKTYEVFIITDSRILSKDYTPLLQTLNTIPKTITPLSLTFIFIDKIKELMTETWDSIVEHGATFIEENSL